MKDFRFILTGLGHVGVNLLQLLQARGALLRSRYGLRMLLVGAADSSGVASSARGLDLPALLALKRQKRGVAELLGAGRRGVPAIALLDGVDAHALMEATPTSLKDGQPGLDLARRALARKMHVVLASKGPLVLGYLELAGMSDMAVPGLPALRFSGAVCGALPTVNVGRRDLAAGCISRIEAALNATTQLILGLMADGRSYADALAEAQRLGIAEPDPSLDVDGWDSANKLVILANAVLGAPATLANVSVEGISRVKPAELAEARAAGGRISVLSVAEALPDNAPGFPSYRFSVKPTALPGGHPLAHLGARDMGIVYQSDIHGMITVIASEQGPEGTAAGMLRDIIEIARAL